MDQDKSLCHRTCRLIAIFMHSVRYLVRGNINLWHWHCTRVEKSRSGVIAVLPNGFIDRISSAISGFTEFLLLWFFFHSAVVIICLSWEEAPRHVRHIVVHCPSWLDINKVAQCNKVWITMSGLRYPGQDYCKEYCTVHSMKSTTPCIHSVSWALLLMQLARSQLTAVSMCIAQKGT